MYHPKRCGTCTCRDATGKFPDYPDDEEGGSEAIFKKREEPVMYMFVVVAQIRFSFSLCRHYALS